MSEGFATSFIQMEGGWALGSNWGWFDTDFLRRAIAAAFGWVAPVLTRTPPPSLFKDGAGNALDGHAHR